MSTHANRRRELGPAREYFLNKAHDLSALPTQLGFLEGVEIARGYFEDIGYARGELYFAGWMLLPKTQLESIRVYLNGEMTGSAAVVLRPDLGRVFPWIPHAATAGFSYRLPFAVANSAQLCPIDLVGYQADRAVACMSTLFRSDLDEVVTSPPPHLRERVAGSQKLSFFRVGGLKWFGEFLGPISKYGNLGSMRRMLDWGCGCGRVTEHFLLLSDGPEIYGCDIDSEAIDWCKEHLEQGSFSCIAARPPTPYEDASFDFVISCSVFTHLSRDAQNAWLSEMRRIIIPGGLFLASVHGEFALLFESPEKYSEPIPDGIYDQSLDPRLDGVAPEGYYRGTYQTREYTIREWSKYFEILEYIERGIGNHQDLVVMRKSDVPVKENRTRSRHNPLERATRGPFPRDAWVNE